MWPQVVKSGDVGLGGREACQAAGRLRGLAQLTAGKDSAPLPVAQAQQGEEASLWPTQARCLPTSQLLAAANRPGQIFMGPHFPSGGVTALKIDAVGEPISPLGLGWASGRKWSASDPQGGHWN